MKNFENLSELLLNTSAPPVMEARRWALKKNINPNLPLLNLSQAAPLDPPASELIEHLKISLDNIDSHTYGPVLGLEELREQISADWSKGYDSEIKTDQIAITSGCNQAFCTAISTIAKTGDRIILPVPWYFNHKMWLDMKGIDVIPLACNGNLEPNMNELRKIDSTGVKALVLVSPNNPSGKEYSHTLIDDCANYVREKGIFLILDETYKDFSTKLSSPHNLFRFKDWKDWFIHLYSFSKAYRLTGYRVGVLISSKKFLSQAEKFLDTVAICPNPLGQKAALFGLKNLCWFVEKERKRIDDRRKKLLANFNECENWKIISSGAYFAYFSYEGKYSSMEVIEKLLQEASLLVLPGTMFGPKNYKELDSTFRVAYANIENAGIEELCNRFKQINWC